MRINSSYGSKERLFEVFQKVNSIVLNETKLIKENKEEIISNFLIFLDGKLDLNGDLPKIELCYDENKAQTMKSFGGYVPELNKILVVMANRNLADILRTIAHEMVHHKQNKNNKINDNSGETGSDIENEANSLAGIYMREYGKNNPNIFE